MALENAGRVPVPDGEVQPRVQPPPRCPACSQGGGAALILPCSHAMCRRCLASGEAARRDGGCSVRCPRCRRAVELPGRTRSAAASWLPRYPTASPAHVRRSDREGASEDQRQDIRPSDTDQGLFHDSGADGASASPAGGAVDLQEEEMAQSVFGLHFALDPSCVPPNLHLSSSFRTVTYQEESPPVNRVKRSRAASGPRVLLPFPHVCADVVIARGQYYWEVDVCNSSAYRIGVVSSDRSCGWWLQRRRWSFHAVYDGSVEPLCTVPPHIKSVGVFLNIGGGALSFHNPLTQEHLATLPTRFGLAGVVPALGLGQGRLRLRCGLPPPAHVFLSHSSAYRTPRGAGGGRWCREVPFRSVRKVIQKFEELAVSDSDAGLVSGVRPSCSTVASTADLGIPGMFYSDSRQETGSQELLNLSPTGFWVV
ncbi:cardiomyopathy-associated protein 5-like [Betta splendens]|uniref:Cardiomyopathy-associated protein 5-like n=1 Tax=Betta splendens TaxID=158456 RepID=A0A6P7PDC6_BETSP|nr:cardiomyopathy-associated protein 5-like [Betta splendens]